MRLHPAFLLGALAATTPLLALAQDKAAAPVTVKFAAQNGSGETGTATLAPDGDATTITIKLDGAPADAQPVHVHEGPCAKLNPKPTYPLESVVDGKSTTKLDVPFAKLMSGEYAINVHKSKTDIATYVACADLKVVTSQRNTTVGAPSTIPGKAY